MLLRYLLYGLLIYFVIRFIFKFVIPVTRAAKDMKSKMNEFQARMQEQQQQQQAPKRPEPVKESTAPKEGDYIEFEEVK
ncbi:MAG: hypothetical protein C0523_06470 [Cytophaga sp.]|nr:hypothetical protein [Cytophaga sp.]